MSLKEAARRRLEAGAARVDYFSLPALEEMGLGAIGRLPFCLRVLLENVLRNLGRNDISEADVRRLLGRGGEDTVIGVPFHPARVLMQDYTGVPALVDLAAMRDAMRGLGGDEGRVNPQIPVDLVVDHSLIVDEAGHAGAIGANLAHEFRRNAERYTFAKWAQRAFANLRVAPPGNGILHQVNIEHIAKLVRVERIDGSDVAFPDTMVGTDSHSSMVNGIGVLGWGVGGIEAEAAMLGLPLVVPLTGVVGVRLTGELAPGVTATDLVLTLTRRLRSFGVVEKFVEFCGPALDRLPVADRATIANMSPEYGSTCAFFPVDRATIDYMVQTGREPDQVALIEAYSKAQGLWRETGQPEPRYDAVMTFDLGEVVPCAAGPRRPQDSVPLERIPDNFRAEMKVPAEEGLADGAVVLAAITSCTNTSNPVVMIGAGLLAKKAVERGLKVKPWVKTSLTPGSRVVGGYLQASGLQHYLDMLGFNIAGYGCATCGGNSGRLAGWVEEEIEQRELVACAVLSGNRNFEARIHPLARASYLMAPPLVVAYALTGSIGVDLTREPLGVDAEGHPVHLRDIWPTGEEIEAVLSAVLSPDIFRTHYAELFTGGEEWHSLREPEGRLFAWDPESTYIRRPPYYDCFSRKASPPEDLKGARVLLVLGDSITTDHISPVGNISPDSPAARFLMGEGVQPRDFNAYGARRSNHEVMVRGTFANIRLRNEMVPGVEGGFTRDPESGEILPVYDAAAGYAECGVPLVVVAGRDYGAGSSRDWAAKGTRLLGVRAVIAESFERIHRANLVSMGVLPLQFPEGTTRHTLGIDGTELFDVEDILAQAVPGGTVTVRLRRKSGEAVTLPARCRLDTANEGLVWRAGGILPFVLRRLSAEIPASGAA